MQIQKSNTKESLEIYTDGGCRGNPGIGAWAFYMPQYDYHETEGVFETTNNRMELYAAIKALQWVNNNIKQNKINLHIILYTDSQYVQKGISIWMTKWQANNWKTANRKPVLNKQLWIELHELNKTIPVLWKWVRGHADNKYNELCDRLVNESMEKQQKKQQ